MSHQRALQCLQIAAKIDLITTGTAKKNVASMVMLGRGDEPGTRDAPARGFDSASLQGSWKTRSRKRNKQKTLEASTHKHLLRR